MASAETGYIHLRAGQAAVTSCCGCLIGSAPWTRLASEVTCRHFRVIDDVPVSPATPLVCSCGQFHFLSNEDLLRRDDDGWVHTPSSCYPGRLDSPTKIAGWVRVPTPDEHVESQIEINPLHTWWVKEAEREATKLVPKAQEYGSYDLQFLGQFLADVIGQDYETAEAMEAGIIFYLIGKIARLASSVKDGGQASDDTYRDIAIYAKMVLYIREKGQWP
jgi:hypothetical protein